MKHVFDTLDGAVQSSFLDRGMRWIPPQDRVGWPADVRPEPDAVELAVRLFDVPAALLAESTSVPGESLSPVSCYPPDAVPLEVS